MARIRASEGGAYESRGKFYARVTTAPQKREGVILPWCTCLEDAGARARALQALVNQLREASETDWIAKVLEIGALADEEKLAALGRHVAGIVEGKIVKVTPGTSTVVTFGTFADRWTSGDLHRVYPDHIEEKSSVDDDIERLTKHVLPHVKDVPLASFTREHADGVMAKLPPALGRGTRRQVAQLVSRVLRLGVFAQAIKFSPLPPGWLPKAPKADSIAKESLLPGEEAQLLAGRNAEGETVVPLAYRVAYAFLHREGMRKGEARGMVWGDVDLKKGMVSLDENKTDRPRSWVLHPSIVRVLTAWKKVSTATKAADPVFVGVQWEKLAPVYRGHCEAVGLTRERLFQKKANKLQLRAHDMRAFFITAGMFAGRDAMWITDRTGHTTLGMLRTYERDVRRWRELGEAPADADAAIPELAAAFAAANAAADPKPGNKEEEPTIEKCTGGELNPYAFRRRNLKTREPETLTDGREVAPDEEDAGELSGTAPPRSAAASIDPVEAALAAGVDAIAVAMATAAPADIVALADRMATLARELHARRGARAGNVVSLAWRHKDRG